MTPSLFFRLLKTPVDAKGEALRELVQNAMREDAARKERGETFALDSADFSLIPGSPFAYWALAAALPIFQGYPRAEGNAATFRRGLGTNDDFRFLRLFWEVLPETVGHVWWLLAKGGAFSPYYYDVHLVVDWEDDGKRLRQFCRERGYSPSRDIRSEDLYFRPGLTWPLRTQKGLNVRALPASSIFGSKGPSGIVEHDDPETLLFLLSTMNSQAFQFLISLQMAFGSYEVGVIQRTPIPSTSHASRSTLAALAREAYDLQREHDLTDETTHAFCLPALALSLAKDRQRREARTLLEASQALLAEAQAAEARLAAIQAEIDDLVFDLYGLDEANRALIRAEMGQPSAVGGQLDDTQYATRDAPDEEADEEAPASPEDLPRRVQDLLMWCVGVAFGRWDVRFALDPGLLPALPGPFDPLPRCAPGALVGADGLPATNDLRLTIDESSRSPIANRQSPIVNQTVAWDGILVDDPTHPSDIVTRVRGVLSLLWGDRADAVEREACQVLGFRSLRDYFRDPRRGFFDFHIKRYSKSRRKAPIYWPLQSEKRGYSVWLYYPRLNPSTLFAAGRDYADAKVALEAARLEELRAGLEALSGSARSQREREVERQANLVAEVTAFRNRLDAVALLTLEPDLNDGVLLTIAPLRELVPWKEAARMWEELVAGKYEWSSMARQMREKGLVKRKT